MLCLTRKTGLWSTRPDIPQVRGQKRERVLDIDKPAIKTILICYESELSSDPKASEAVFFQYALYVLTSRLDDECSKAIHPISMASIDPRWRGDRDELVREVHESLNVLKIFARVHVFLNSRSLACLVRVVGSLVIMYEHDLGTSSGRWAI
jgi:hypothetical protein